MRSRLLISATAMLLSTLTGCGGERANDEVSLNEGSLKKALELITTNTILPAVGQFSAQTQALADNADSFCAAPDSNTLNAVQQQWKNTADAWYQLLPFNFGPLDDDLVFPTYQYIDSYRLRGTDYTETVRTNISSWLASSETLDETFFAAQTFQKVGLLALEVALFETSDTHSTAASDIVSEYVASSRKCDALNGLSDYLNSKAQAIETGWSTEFADSGSSYKALFLGDALPDGSAALTTLITAQQEFLDYLQQRNVVTTITPLADHAWSMAGKALDSIEQVIEGSDDTAVSLASLMRASGNQTSVDTVRSNLAMARDSISDLDATSFNSAAALLDGNFKREIPDSLDVNLGINFTDGD